MNPSAPGVSDERPDLRDPKIPTRLGSMILGGLLALAVTDSVNATASTRRLQTPASAFKLDQSLAGTRGTVDVIVQLSGQPLAVMNGVDARRGGGRLNRVQQIAYSQQLRREQDAVLSRVLALGGKEIGRVRIAYNAAIVRIDSSRLDQLATIPGVASVQRAQDFRVSLSETVPYVGAAAVQAAGLTGKGVRIAVLDSGIDYTHRNLGGPGTAAAYEAAWGKNADDARNTNRDGVFPTSKVIEGRDFVGEAWTGEENSPPLAEDADPIDSFGHGTHVADIIAGRSNDGKHVGVAPGASLIAVKVCSAVTTACSGIALLEGLDYALDPNDDGSVDDAADIINMSLGAPYGQREDSTAVAAANAARMGIIVVTAAGNSSDKPYDLGSPGIAPEVITVAQTQVPSAAAIPLVITAPSSIAGAYKSTATLDWARVEGDTEARIAYVGRGCQNDVYKANPAGLIALIDRGDCNISLKIRRASDAGAKAVIIALDKEGEPTTFSNGGDCPAGEGACKPTIVIPLALADTIRANIGAGVQAQISEANGIALDASVAGTSARGPSYDYNQIKPDIAAPGASVSAQAGTGAGETAFGGTSGATPMVSGAAALLLEAYPNRSPTQIKAALMNSADSKVYADPVFQPLVLAPITRIGAGELQVDKAVASTTAAWEVSQRTGSLSFGYLNVSSDQTIVRTVRVQNFSGSSRRYEVRNEFRFADDAATGAVKIFAPSNVTVPPYGSASFDVIMKIDAARLPAWGLFGGANTGSGSLLKRAEFDGYLTLRDATDTVRLPWQVLPHRSGDLHVVNSSVALPAKGFGMLGMVNLSRAQPATFDVFALTGTSPRLRRPPLAGAVDELTIHDIAAVGVRQDVDRDGNDVVQFAIHTYGRRAHPAYPGRFDVFIDADNDGVPDYRVFNAELGAFDSSGVTVIGIDNLSIPTDIDARAYYYADADLDSANLIMTVPMAQVGIRADRKFRFDVEAHDNYFSGSLDKGLTDAVRGSVVTLQKLKYSLQPNVPLPAEGVPARSGVLLKVEALAGGEAASPSQTGFLLMYRDAAVEAETVAITRGPS
jgi:subtilisin family serine protease